MSGIFYKTLSFLLIAAFSLQVGVTAAPTIPSGLQQEEQSQDLGTHKQEVLSAQHQDNSLVGNQFTAKPWEREIEENESDGAMLLKHLALFTIVLGYQPDLEIEILPSFRHESPNFTPQKLRPRIISFRTFLI